MPSNFKQDQIPWRSCTVLSKSNSDIIISAIQSQKWKQSNSWTSRPDTRADNTGSLFRSSPQQPTSHDKKKKESTQWKQTLIYWRCQKLLRDGHCNRILRMKIQAYKAPSQETRQGKEAGQDTKWEPAIQHLGMVNAINKKFCNPLTEGFFSTPRSHSGQLTKNTHVSKIPSNWTQGLEQLNL